MEKIAQAQAGFRSLTEAIDTTSAGGRMMMQIVASFAEFERAMLRERTRSGLDEARKQGRLGGRRHKLRPNQQEEIVSLVHTGQKNAAAAAQTVQRPSRDRIASFAAQQNSLPVFYVPLRPKPPTRHRRSRPCARSAGFRPVACCSASRSAARCAGAGCSWPTDDGLQVPARECTR